MMRTNWQRLLLTAACAAATWPAAGQAPQPAGSDVNFPRPATDTIVVDPKLYLRTEWPVSYEVTAGANRNTSQEAGTHWIGVGCSPATETLRSQLKLEPETGLVVDHVFPDSPAAKAGLKVHDLLLKARHGEESVDLHSLVDLAKAVSAAKTEELKVELLRVGERQTITVTPIERPASITLVPPGDFTFPVVPPAGELKESPPGGVYRLNVAGPAFAFAHVRKFGGLPEGVTVSITRTGNEPAKVTVKRGEQSWETTEKDLSVLPEDLRGSVKEMLQHPPHPLGLPGVPWDTDGPVPPHQVMVPVRPGVPFPPQPPVPPQVFRIEKVVPGQPQELRKEDLQRSREALEREMNAKLEKLQKLQLQEQKAQLEALDKKIEALQQAVEKLQAPPAEKPQPKE